MKAQDPRAYQFSINMEVVDLDGKYGGDVDAAFVGACQELTKKPASVLCGDIEYHVMDKTEDVVGRVALRLAMESSEQGES
tara:strand:+ start:798 stop:1040 length:243 start_codon:yes stop_codon:yes gene_type:complete